MLVVTLVKGERWISCNIIVHRIGSKFHTNLGGGGGGGGLSGMARLGSRKGIDCILVLVLIFTSFSLRAGEVETNWQLSHYRQFFSGNCMEMNEIGP